MLDVLDDMGNDPVFSGCLSASVAVPIVHQLLERLLPGLGDMESSLVEAVLHEFSRITWEYVGDS